MSWTRGCPVAVLALAIGCVPPPIDVPPEDGDTFLAIDMTSFGSPQAVPVFGNSITAETREVSLPPELVESAPEEMTLTLSTAEIDPSLAVGHVNPLSKDGAFHATIVFHLAAPGEDACASPLIIGPYEMSMANGHLVIENNSIQLSPQAVALVLSGKFQICVETSADFDGALFFNQLIIEFGRLGPGDSRVEICHVSPGNPKSHHTITVGSSAVVVHLARGSYLGKCLDEIQALELTSVCSNYPDAQRRWRVRNPNALPVEVAWEVYGTDQAGTLTAGPGDSYFETQTVGGPNTTVIRWTDHNGIERSTVKASGGLQCEIDTDGDGVIDPSDACPATPSGEAVDATGCSCSQRDGDGDGVDDCTDACPGTASGVSVDAVGCDIPQPEGDADGDGVPDSADNCPDTPAGAVADPTGCSCGQLDEDADGVNDCNDFCPGTAADMPVDANGCEIMVAEAGQDVELSEVGPVTLTAAANGGTAPYTYSWSAPGWAGATQQTITVMPAQTTVYTLTVADWSFPPQIATDTVTVTIVPKQGLQYTVVNVGSLSSKNSYANGLNNHGDVVGYYYTETWAKRAFLFKNGALSDIGTLGGTEAYASAINDNGQVVGQSKTAGGRWHAFIWDAVNGMQDLGTLGGVSSEAYAINDIGQVTGFSETGTGNQAFIYSGGVMTAVPGTEAFAQSGAFDINDAGHMAGILLTAGGDSVAFVYAGGLVNLGSPLLTGSEAWLINNRGVVAGHSWGTTQYRSFIHADGNVVDLGLLSGFERAYAWGLSDSGQVVGSVTNAVSGLSHAFIYTGGKMLDLNSLLAAGHGWDYLTAANAVNENGQVTGYGKINGQFRGFLLTPKP